MSTEPSDDAVRHDAWLREALRHAPDADVAPPQALREAILRQARATAAPARPVRTFEAFWRGFTRPAVATGFASLMVSVVLTLMWRSDEFEDEAARTRPSAQVPAAPAPQTSEPAPVADASTRPADAGATAKLEKAAPAKRPMRAVQPPAPAPAPAAAPAAPPAERRADAPLAAHAPRSRDALTRGEAVPATAASLAVDPLPHVATGAALRWTWAGSSHPHGDAQQAWLDRLRSATAGRWQRAGDVTRDGLRIRLFDGAEPRGEVVLARNHVLWLDPARGAWRAPLAEPDAAQLESLARQW
jgi:hypothetical protein